MTENTNLSTPRVNPLQESPQITSPTKSSVTTATTTATSRSMQFPKKFSPKMIIGGLFFALLLIGGIAAYYLSTQSQDVRQQAAYGLTCNSLVACPSGYTCDYDPTTSTGVCVVSTVTPPNCTSLGGACQTGACGLGQESAAGMCTGSGFCCKSSTSCTMNGNICVDGNQASSCADAGYTTATGSCGGGNLCCSRPPAATCTSLGGACQTGACGLGQESAAGMCTGSGFCCKSSTSCTMNGNICVDGNQASSCADAGYTTATGSCGGGNLCCSRPPAATCASLGGSCQSGTCGNGFQGAAGVCVGGGFCCKPTTTCTSNGNICVDNNQAASCADAGYATATGSCGGGDYCCRQVTAPPNLCDTENPCAAGFSCNRQIGNGACVPVTPPNLCDTDLPCAAGYVCNRANGGTCKPTCQTNGNSCVSTRIAGTCFDAGYINASGVCSSGNICCKANNPPNLCDSDNPCQSGFRCDRQNGGTCVPVTPPNLCDQDVPCAPGYKCVTGGGGACVPVTTGTCDKLSVASCQDKNPGDRCAATGGGTASCKITTGTTCGCDGKDIDPPPTVPPTTPPTTPPVGTCSNAAQSCESQACCNGFTCQGLAGSRICQGLVPGVCGSNATCGGSNGWLGFRCTNLSNGQCLENPQTFNSYQEAYAYASANGCGQVDEVCVGGNANRQLCGQFNIINQSCGGVNPPPGVTPTPGTTPSIPPAPVCTNIAMNRINPRVGDSVAFTCGAIPGVNKYEFRVRLPNGTIQTLASLDTSVTTSVNFTVSQAGAFKAQCRICPNNQCQAWEQL